MDARPEHVWDAEMLKLLNGLQTVGERDSTDRFRLDPARALERMSRFQLPDPRMFVLNLVAGAVASGASLVDVETSPQWLTLGWDGCGLGFEHMLNLLDPFGPGTPCWLADLARGLAASRALPLPEVVVESWSDAAGGWALCMGAEGVAVDRLAERPSDLPENLVNRICLREHPGLWSRTRQAVDRALRKAPSMTPEWEFLKLRCALSPVPIRVNGIPVNVTLRLPPCHEVLQLRGPVHLPCDYPGRAPHRSASGNFSAWVGLVREQPADRASLTVLLHGLTFELEGELPYPGALVVLAAPALTRDLSGLTLVCDLEYQRIMNTLFEHLDRMVFRHLAEGGGPGALEQPLAARLMSRLGSPRGGRPALKARVELAASLGNGCFVHTASGRRTPLPEAMLQYVRRGYLPVAAQVAPSSCAPTLAEDSSPVFLATTRGSRKLLEIFCPELIPIQWCRHKPILAGARRDWPRLPCGEYLVRRLLRDWPGEVGLRLDRGGNLVRRRDLYQVVENSPLRLNRLDRFRLQQIPSGLVAVVGTAHPETLVQAIGSSLGDLYEAVILGLRVYDSVEFACAMWHLMECVNLCIRLWQQARAAGCPSRTPRELLETGSGEWGPAARPVDPYLLDAARFLPSRTGPRMTLTECLERPHQALVQTFVPTVRLFLLGDCSRGS